MIHPSALVHPQAEVHPDAVVGPWCLVDAGAVLEAGVVLESRVRVYGGVLVGEGTRIYDGAVIGGDPQDLKYKGESTLLRIGKACRIREYCTLNRGTGLDGQTLVGDEVLLMAYVHVAHDCEIGAQAVLANGVQLGGHARIGRCATIGGNTAVHQFSRVGDYAFVGGTLKIDRDVPPASRALGNPLKWAGLNLHALRRFPELFPASRLEALEQAYRLLYRSGVGIEKAVSELLAADELFQGFFQDWKGQLIRP